MEQAEQQERGPRQRGVSRRQVLAEGRHGTRGASGGQGTRGRGVTAGVPEARRRLGGEERRTAPWRARPGTRLSAERRARGGRNCPWRALRTRGPPQGRRELGAEESRSFAPCRLPSPRPGPYHCLPPTPASTQAYPGFHKNWKSGQGLRREFLGPATSPRAPVLHPLKGAPGAGKGRRRAFPRN